VRAGGSFASDVSVVTAVASGLSQIMQFSLYNDLEGRPFNPQPLLEAYPMQLTRLENWIAEKVETGRVAATLA
jgi:hypothetical protein